LKSHQEYAKQELDKATKEQDKVKTQLSEAEAKLSEAEAKRKEAKQELSEAEAKLSEAEAKQKEAKQELDKANTNQLEHDVELAKCNLKRANNRYEIMFDISNLAAEHYKNTLINFITAEKSCTELKEKLKQSGEQILTQHSSFSLCLTSLYIFSIHIFIPS